jgi:hypothetical protein
VLGAAKVQGLATLERGIPCGCSMYLAWPGGILSPRRRARSPVSNGGCCRQVRDFMGSGHPGSHVLYYPGRTQPLLHHLSVGFSCCFLSAPLSIVTAFHAAVISACSASCTVLLQYEWKGLEGATEYASTCAIHWSRVHGSKQAQASIHSVGGYHEDALLQPNYPRAGRRKHGAVCFCRRVCRRILVSRNRDGDRKRSRIRNSKALFGHPHACSESIRTPKHP